MFVQCVSHETLYFIVIVMNRLYIVDKFHALNMFAFSKLTSDDCMTITIKLIFGKETGDSHVNKQNHSHIGHIVYDKRKKNINRSII
jgi:hypothetical protein